LASAIPKIGAILPPDVEMATMATVPSEDKRVRQRLIRDRRPKPPMALTELTELTRR
jgi:hypothetical protein